MQKSALPSTSAAPVAKPYLVLGYSLHLLVPGEAHNTVCYHKYTHSFYYKCNKYGKTSRRETYETKHCEHCVFLFTTCFKAAQLHSLN